MLSQLRYMKTIPNYYYCEETVGLFYLTITLEFRYILHTAVWAILVLLENFSYAIRFHIKGLEA
jgi:hypothetical protein